MSTINDTDLLLVERNGVQYQITYDQMSTLNDDDLLLVERGGVQYKVEAQDISTGPNGLIIPPVEVLTPVNGAGITEFDQYEPVSSAITVVGEAGTIAKNTDDIQSVTDISNWNQSQTWSSGTYTGPTPPAAHYAVEMAFNGLGEDGGSFGPNIYWMVEQGPDATLTFNSPINISSNSTLDILGANYEYVAANGGRITFECSNGSVPVTLNADNNAVAKTTISDAYSTFGSQITAITVTPASNGSMSIVGFFVDGQRLVDAGIAGATITGKTLSFPTNTNFSGLSVGDVVQGGLVESPVMVVTHSPGGTDWVVEKFESASVARTSTQYLSTFDHATKYKSLCFYLSDPTSDVELTMGGSGWTTYSSVDGVSWTQGTTVDGGPPVLARTLISNNPNAKYFVFGALNPGYPFSSWVTFKFQTSFINNWNPPYTLEMPAGGSVRSAASITAIDASAPSQQQVYATLNPLAKNSTVTLSNGNLDATSPSWAWSTATIAVSSGKWYWELTRTNAGADNIASGIVKSSFNDFDYNFAPGGAAQSDIYAYTSLSGNKEGQGSNTSYGDSYTAAGDVIGVALDMDAGTLTFYKNGVSQGQAFSGITDEIYPVWGGTGGTASAASLNFGATAFAHTPPTGYTGVSELVTTYPSVTVDGGTWDTSNQSQVWSSGSSSNFSDLSNAFNEIFTDYAEVSSGAKGTLTFPAPITVENNITFRYSSGTAGNLFVNDSPTAMQGTSYQTQTVSFTGTLTSISLQSGSSPVLYYLEVDGQLLIDPVENSQIWSLPPIFDDNGYNYYDDRYISNVFDATTTNFALPAYGGTWKLDFGTHFSSATTVEISLYEGGVNPTLKVNDALQSYQGANEQIYTIDVTGSGLTSIEWSYIDANNSTNIYYIKVDGKRLVDNFGLGDSYLNSSTSYETSLTFTDTTELANMVGPLEMTDANGDVVTPVSDTIANVSNNVLTLQGNTNIEYFQPGDEVQTGVEIVSVDTAAPSITVDGGEWSGADGTNTAKKISRSLRFDSASSSYIHWTPSSAGNQKTWTWSGWVKRADLDNECVLFSGSASPGANYYITFSGGSGTGTGYNGLSFFYGYGVHVGTALNTFRDTSAWYHIVVEVDTTQSTAADRVKIYVNGTEITYGYTNYPSQNADLGINSSYRMSMGSINSYAAWSLSNLYLAEVHFVDGQAIAPTEFGEPDSNGVWNPKEFSGTYGTNGFYLDFSDNSSNAALGTDTSGNSNTWTVNNLSVASGAGNDSLVDTPTNYGDDTGAGGEVRGNYATLNPLHTLATATLANGNLQTTSSNPAFSSILITSGKWYVEHTVTTAAYNLCFSQIDHPSGATPSSSNSKSIGWYTNGTVYWGAGDDDSSATSYVAGDVLAAAIDMDNSTIKLYKNGSLETTIDFTSSNYHRFAEGMYVSQFSGTGHWNFGQRAWTHAAPSGYKALCDTNLPSATIKDGAKHFDVVTYTGDGGTQSISSLNFQPDLVWIKCRDIAYSHNLYDSLRGHTNALYTDRTDAEVAETRYGYLSSFDSNGFTLSPGSNDNDNTHRSGTNYVAWAWNAGDTTETIAAGSLGNYNTDRVWSDNLSVASGSFDQAVTNAFNGDNSNKARTSGDAVLVTLTFSPALTVTSSVELIADLYAGGDFQYTATIDGNTTTQNVTGANPAIFGSGSLTQLTIQNNAPGRSSLMYVKVDGATLVNSNTTPPTLPSIGSEVRANPAAGFSVVSVTEAAASGGSTVAHGLNTKPQMIIEKSRTGSTPWYIHHSGLGDMSGSFLRFDTSAKQADNAWNIVEPTSTTFGIDPNYVLGDANADVIYYLFAPVEGYSAMGSYTGNGSTDGTFVFTGFRPAFVLLKCTSAGSTYWSIQDNERLGVNPEQDLLFPNTSDSENATSYMDFLSNGFKLRNDHTYYANASEQTYIYYAVAENPVTQDSQTGTGDTQVALDALVASATEIVETDGTTMYLNGATGPWRTGLSIEGSQINAAPPGPSEITFTSQNQGTPVFSGVDATLASRTWTLESSTTATGPWTQVDTYNDFGVLSTQTGATPWTENKPTLQPNTFYRIKVAYNSTNATSVESVYNTFKTGDA